jgi:hypothetical protein
MYARNVTSDDTSSLITIGTGPRIKEPQEGMTSLTTRNLANVNVFSRRSFSGIHTLRPQPSSTTRKELLQ